MRRYANPTCSLKVNAVNSEAHPAPLPGLKSVERVREITGGRGADIVLEMVGKKLHLRGRSARRESREASYSSERPLLFLFPSRSGTRRRASTIAWIMLLKAAASSVRLFALGGLPDKRRRLKVHHSHSPSTTTAVFGVPNTDRYSFAMSQFFRKNVELVRAWAARVWSWRHGPGSEGSRSYCLTAPPSPERTSHPDELGGLCLSLGARGLSLCCRADWVGQDPGQADFPGAFRPR